MRMQVQYVNDMERPGYTVEHGKTPDSIAKSVFGEEAESRNVTDPRFGGPYVFVINGVIMAHAKITHDEDKTPEPEKKEETKKEKKEKQEDAPEGWGTHTVNPPYEGLAPVPSALSSELLEERPEDQDDEDQDAPEEPDKAAQPVEDTPPDATAHLEPLKPLKAQKGSNSSHHQVGRKGS